MGYLVIGINHQKAPVEIREKYSFDQEGIKRALQELSNDRSIKEIFILSTCNRVEFYLITDDKEESKACIGNFLLKMNPQVGLDDYFYQFEDNQAILHLFKVASSLDSMVVGENQILSQVKEAFNQAIESQTIGFGFNPIINKTLSLAKKVRTDTDIAKGLVSIASVAVDLAQKLFKNLQQKKVAVIGAGEMAELMIENLLSQGVKDLSILNRHTEKAKELVNQYGLGKVYSLENLKEVLTRVDIVLSSIHVEKPIIDSHFFKSILPLRKNGLLFMIDLGVPRNISQDLNKFDNTYIYDIDDLSQICSENKKRRKNEAIKAQEMIEKECLSFYESLSDEKPTLKALGRKIEQIRKMELDKTLSRLDHLTAQDKMAIERCTKAIVNKIIHDPVFTFKTHSEEEKDKAGFWLKKLFRLEDEN